MTAYLIVVFRASSGSKRRHRSTGAGLHFNFSNDFNRTDADSKSMHTGVNFGTRSAKTFVKQSADRTLPLQLTA